MGRTWSFTVDGAPAGAWPARVSIPVPRGEGIGKAYAVRRPDGSVVPAQARTLAPWPDGSPRWVQLDFQANAPGACVVQVGGGNAAPALPVSAAKDGGAFTVSVGRLRVAVDPAAGNPIARIEWAGRELAGKDEFGAFRVVDEGMRSHLPSGGAREVKVEAEGPCRFQLSWETEHRDPAGNRSLDIRFRAEFLAGIEGFVLSYQFFHKLPNRDYLHLKSIDATFALPGLKDAHGVAVQQNYSNLGQRRVVRTKKTVPLLIDSTCRVPYVEELSCIEDDFPYPYFLNNAHTLDPMVAVEDAGVAVMLAMRNLADLRPKTVTVSPGIVEFGIWPERAGTLKLPQGRSSAQQFAVLFTDPERLDGMMTPQIANLEPAMGWLDAADSAHAGASWDAPRLFTGEEPGAAIFHYMLGTATHQYVLASGMFDLGDSPQIGYTQSYAGGGFRPHNERPTRELPFHAGLGGESLTLPSMVPIETLTPVWSNNEYDAIYCLALQALRTRSLPVLRKLRASARHQIEVDFIHYSDHWQHHRGTPCHTYDHNACSTAYPSHQWTQGLYYYYCLTGDDDVPEVVRAICDFNIAWLARPELACMHYFNREMGWGALALAYGYELTGETKYADAAKTILRELEETAAQEDFEKLTQKFSTARGSNRSLLGLAFAINTIPLALTAYHQATGDPWARDVLIEWVDLGMVGFNDRRSGSKLHDLFPEPLAYVCELTGDRRRLEETLWQLHMFMLGYPALNWTAGAGGPLDGKMFGRVYRGLAHYLSACARAGLLKDAEDRLLGAKGEAD